MQKKERGENNTRMERIRSALETSRTVAILRLGSIGDVLATLPVAWLLRDLLPRETRLVWIAHSTPGGLLAGVRALDRLILLPRLPLVRGLRVWRRMLRAERVDAVLDLHGTLKSGLVSLLTGAPHRIGLSPRDCREAWNRLATRLELPPTSSDNKTRRALEVGQLLGHPCPEPRFGLEFSPMETARARQVLEDTSLHDRPVLLLQLGRAADVRAWPLRHAADLVRSAASIGRRIVVLGGPEEVESGGRLRELLQPGSDCIRFEVGTLSLRELGALFTLLARDGVPGHAFVGADSGALHLAAACGLFSVGIFGPQDPARTAPIGSRLTILRHPEVAPCIPCGRRECHYPVPLVCMESVTPAEVLRHLTPPRPPTSETSVTPPAPGHEPDVPSPSLSLREGPRRERLQALLQAVALLAFALAVLAPAVLRGGPWSTGEARVAEVARETWPCGRHLLPHLNGDALGGLPSADSFIRALSMSFLGSSVFAARLPSLLAALLLVLVIFLAGRRIAGRRIAGIGTLLIAVLWGISLSGSSATVEILSTVLVTTSLFLYLGPALSGCRPAEPRVLLAGLLAVAALLAGGVPALLIPVLAIVLAHVGNKSTRELTRPLTLLVAVLLGLFTAAWMLPWRAGGTASPPSDSWLPAVAAPVGPEMGGLQETLLGFLLAALPLTPILPFFLYAHFRMRRFREDLGFADRRWRFPKAAVGACILTALCLPRTARGTVIASLPWLALLAAAWIESFRSRGDGTSPPRGRASRLSVAGRVLVPALFLVLGIAAAAQPFLREAPFAGEHRAAVETIGRLRSEGARLVGYRWSPGVRGLLAFHLGETVPWAASPSALAAHLEDLSPGGPTVWVVMPADAVSEVLDVLSRRLPDARMHAKTRVRLEAAEWLLLRCSRR